MTWTARRRTLRATFAASIPGIALCGAITLAALQLQTWEDAVFGRPWLEALVLALLVGALIRTLWHPSRFWQAGIDVCAKLVLEIAVVLLGSGISTAMILAAGLPLLVAIFAVVAAAIPISYGLARMFALPPRMAMLIACGNSICGNSAIAAVAPVIDADADDVAASIAFTAVLGIAVVLILPAVAVAFRLRPETFGALAGLTVYAVPQVLAATAPISSLASQVGTLVKLIRVLTLGPVVVVLSALNRSGWFGPACDGASVAGAPTPSIRRPALRHLVPWFIVGFLAMIALRSGGILPLGLIEPFTRAANLLTIVAMAGLGLTVEVRMVARAGLRVTSVVILSLLALAGLASIVVATVPIN